MTQLQLHDVLLAACNVLRRAELHLSMDVHYGDDRKLEVAAQCRRMSVECEQTADELRRSWTF